MHDRKWILENLDEATARLRKRNPDLSFGELVGLDKRLKAAIAKSEAANATLNLVSSTFQPKADDALKAEALARAAEFAATHMPDNPAPTAFDKAALQAWNKSLKELSVTAAEERKLIEAEMDKVLYDIPNLPQVGVPEGRSDAENVVVRTWGTPRDHDFPAMEHDALGSKLNILDFESASRLSGNGFAVYRGLGARLERALQSFFLDTHVDRHGYEEVLTPFIVRRDAMVGTGQLPKFEEDAYRIEPDDLFLIPTAEVPITNLYREQMLDGAKLPLKLCGFSPCFRREAGSHGREVRGLTRVHQFQKVELVHITTPEDSGRIHEELVAHAEAILQMLELPYRVIELCGGDLGFGASKCYDLEVWLPVQKRWREISSCSNFLDFQARRADIRYRPEPGAKPRYAHTLNGSGLAIGRTVMAILEVYQTADGRVRVPEALRPYMRVDHIG
jgi:seryl-tRNA synthetase